MKWMQNWPRLGVLYALNLARCFFGLGWALLRRRWRFILCTLGLMLLGSAGIAYRVAKAGAGRIFTVSTVPAQPVAVVFGAGVYPDGSLPSVLADRMLTAIMLYRAGKVSKLLLSGDNRLADYDEPSAMRAYAMNLGVPAQDLYLDPAGFHTFDTCYRAHAVFGIDRAVLVTQRYHLSRALYTCQGVGMDAVGVAADRQRYQRYAWYLLREQISRVVAFIQIKLTI